jgi:hypothetical protein
MSWIMRDVLKSPLLSGKPPSRTFVEVAAKGIQDCENPHITTFAPSDVRTFSALYLDRDLTVCHSSWFWTKHALYLLYALVIMYMFATTSFPDGEPGAGHTCDPGLNVAMCQLEVTLDDAKSEFRFLIAFVLAGYVASTVAAWNRRRANYAALVGSTRDTTVHVNAFLGGDDAEVVESRTTISRWINLAFEIAMLRPKAHMESDIGRDYLLGRALLIPGEWEAMVPGDRHTTVFVWIASALASLGRAGKVPPSWVDSMSNRLSSMRAACQDPMETLSSLAPYPYSSLTAALVSINIAIFCTWKGVSWACWAHEFGWAAVWAQPKMWADLVIMVSWNVSYQAMYDLAYVLHSPFGDRRIDIAHETIGHGVQRFSRAVSTAGQPMPPYFTGKGQPDPSPVASHV